MRCLTYQWLLWSSLLLQACQNGSPPVLDTDDGQVVVEQIPQLTPAERALANQIANRTLLQSVIDANANLERLETPFACAPQRGGLLVVLQDSAGVQSRRLARTGNDHQEVAHWYYRKGDLMLVVYEYSQWRGEDEVVEQTLFYTKNDSLLHMQRKTARGNAHTLSNQLQQAQLEAAPLDQVLWTHLQGYEERLQRKTDWCASSAAPPARELFRR